ncbi:prepilin-type N-terminal cleavage/methylation domain-containing protein [Izhakiella capsodis]|uniref:Prepilin-type N-terminal cleavage/methylation domain-containing protein n=1 Tax=Izhakiella capsodis TaxID=1367852 RepID=A0A1I4W6K3_9GAMM|nr:prepilin-type N-terminal cleavage/methylation domain-containing protein [Izhakiella capsodis]SFN09258.1 prepilin-type N-terminal cleavage/methylation domain-containing protein [Izhakiella capsodis]
MSHSQHGFSLPEMLLALLLMNIILCALLHGQQAISQGFVGQWQQRERWQSLRQGVQGLPAGEYNIHLQLHPGPQGCQLIEASLPGQQKKTHLNQLVCDKLTARKVNTKEASLPDLPSIYSG